MKFDPWRIDPYTHPTRASTPLLPKSDTLKFHFFI
jgi:hypothetical protein